MAPCAWKAPVTHHRTVVRTCQWCAETKFPAGINLVQTVAPGWRQIESEMALDLITIPAVSALAHAGSLRCSSALKVIALLTTSWTRGHSLSKPVSEEYQQEH